MTIDGKEVHSVENTNPKTFTNVRVFAGDGSKPPSDASYRNLLWFFRVRLELMIHSHKKDITSVLAFKGNGGESSCCKFGDRIPIINIRNQRLHFATSLDGNGNYHVDFDYNLNTWYNISIEYKSVNRKVWGKFNLLFTTYSIFSFIRKIIIIILILQSMESWFISFHF